MRQAIYNTKLSSLIDQRDNNFNLIRIIAATCVLISHSYALLGQSEPLESLLGVNLGNLSVYVFFATSGFLLTHSLVRNDDVYRFIKARSLRIFPALWVMIALTVIITGIIFRPSDFFSYLTEKQTIKYIAYNVIVLFGIVYNIPSIHDGAPINGSLWSLKPELQMYITLLILLVLSRLGRTLARTLTTRLFQVAVVMTFAICVIAGTLMSVKRHELGVLAGMFFGGSTIYILRKHVTLRTIIIIAGIIIPLFMFSNKISMFSFMMIALPLVTIIAAYTRSNILLAYNQLGDYSYGIYLYAFPIQQILIWSKFIKNPIELMMHALLLSLLFSVLSWHIIEKPVLRLK